MSNFCKTLEVHLLISLYLQCKSILCARNKCSAEASLLPYGINTKISLLTFELSTSLAAKRPGEATAARRGSALDATASQRLYV